MKQKVSGGLRLFGFRQGDRSEYLALYALTRVAFITPVPRQEDFGVVDFRCVLARREDSFVVPHGAFHVQVKSEGAELELRSGEIRWISTNMDCPLFICVVDKARAAMRLYSCLNLWTALFFRMHPQRIRLVTGRSESNDMPFVHREGTSGNAVLDVEGEFDVFLGEPCIDMTLAEFEQNADRVFEILDAWIRLDRLNVALMRVGRAAACTYQSATPNEVPSQVGFYVFHRPVNQHGLLDKLCPILDSLRQSYDRFGQPERARQIASLLEAFRADMASSEGTTDARLLLE
jgi:hypothetical protein